MQRYFPRTFHALDDIFAFTGHFYECEAVPASIRNAIDLSVEELFTNMVKYNSRSPQAIRITLKSLNKCVEVSLTDFDAERFDSTAASPVDVEAPIDARAPGGLGLHLVRRMVDSLDYEYSNGQSRITFRKRME